MRSGINDYLLGALWPALKTRLDTATMQSFTGAVGRVYALGIDDLPVFGGVESAAWKRVVVVPAETLWPTVEGSGEPTGIAWLIRAEANDLVAPGYDPSIGLELIQREAYRRLDTWRPTSLSNLQVVQPIYRLRRPQAVPQRDEDRGLLFTSAEYRTVVAGTLAVSP